VRAVGLFAGGTQFMGWTFVAIGSLFVLLFTANADWAWLRFAFGETAGTTAYVESVEETAFTVSNRSGPRHHRPAGAKRRPIRAVHYTYATPDGREYRGVSYGSQARWLEDGEAPVRYLVDDPGVSRLSGLRGAPVVLVLGLLPLGVVAFGMVFLVPALRRGWVASRLLSTGAIAQGRLVEKRKTNVTDNNRRVWRFTYEFSDDRGQTHQVSARTNRTRAMQDEPTETVLYDPDRPERAVVFDALPGRIGVDERGVPTTTPATVFGVMLLPGVVMTGYGVWLTIWLAGG
jgi:hypothetical protein